MFKWPFLGPSEAPQGHFGGCKGVQVAHPSCGLRCSTMLIVQPVFNQFEAARAANGQIRPNMARNGRFGGPLRPPGSFWWVQRGPSGPSQMWATMFNHVQPVFNQFGAARAAYGQIRPNMAIFGSKMAIVGPYGRNVVHSRLNIAPLNISDKFCFKSFCRL